MKSIVGDSIGLKHLTFEMIIFYGALFYIVHRQDVIEI